MATNSVAGHIQIQTYIVVFLQWIILLLCTMSHYELKFTLCRK